MSKSSSRKKTRRLWLDVHSDFSACKKPPKRKKFIETLIASIANGTYKLPKCWNVTLKWKNKESAEFREGEWKAELDKSSESSPGFDYAVTTYLERKL